MTKMIRDATSMPPSTHCSTHTRRDEPCAIHIALALAIISRSHQ
jgi:hypothetical protein